MIPVAAEAKTVIAVLIVVAVILHALFGLFIAIPLWVLVIFTLVVFRDFSRVAPAQPLACISPADAQVLSMGIEQDPYLHREALKIRLQQNSLGEFNIHSPVEGEVEKRWSTRPDDRNTERSESSRRTIAVWLQTDEKDDVVVAMDLSSPLRVMLLGIQPGERVGQGQRCGIVGFGRPVDVYLPSNSHSKVKPGQRVKAGSDIIAILRLTKQP